MTRPRLSPRLRLLADVASGATTTDLLAAATGLTRPALRILLADCVLDGLLTVYRGRYSPGPELAVARDALGRVTWVGKVQVME